MALVLIRYFDTMNILLNAYSNIEAGESWPFDPSYLDPNVASDSQQNEILSLMRVPRAVELRKIILTGK